MTRGLDAAQLALLTGPHRSFAPLVELNFDSGTLRLTLTPWNLTEGSNVWISSALLQIRDVRESVGSTEGLQLSLSGLDPAIHTLASQERYRGRIVRLLKAYFNPSNYTAIVGTPRPWFIGRMKAMNIEEMNNECRVDLVAEHYEDELDRPTPTKLNDADQQRFFPGDLGAQHVESTAEKKLTWPEKQLLIKESRS